MVPTCPGPHLLRWPNILWLLAASRASCSHLAVSPAPPYPPPGLVPAAEAGATLAPAQPGPRGWELEERASPPPGLRVALVKVFLSRAAPGLPELPRACEELTGVRGGLLPCGSLVHYCCTTVLKQGDLKQPFHLAHNSMVWEFWNSESSGAVCNRTHFQDGFLTLRLGPPGSRASVSIQHLSSAKSFACGFGFSQHATQGGSP